jgi:hypothetical protein
VRVGVQGVAGWGVNALAKKAKRSRLVIHLPPRRTASNRTILPSGPRAPESTHLNTHASETGAPPRPGGSRRAAWLKDRVVSERIAEASSFISVGLRNGSYVVARFFGVYLRS